MTEKEMKRITKKKSYKKHAVSWVRTIGHWLMGLTILSCLTALIIGAFTWARLTDHFNLESIKLSGNQYLNRDEVLEWINLPRYPNLSKLDLEAIQTKLASHPYIKTSRVSRDFPSTLQIEIIERTPIAYINHTPFYLIDKEGVILPVKEDAFEFDVPILSGFNPASELYPEGERCLSQKVLEAVEILGEIHDFFPKLYRDLSEIMIDARDEYVLCLSKQPTKIYLGSEDISEHVRLLHYFEKSLYKKRTLYDYRYVDLRYKKQIIVKERV